MVGLSLLTLVPGAVGGSETYVRALAKALAARGRADVTAFVPPVAPDAGEGLPTELVGEYRPARTLRARALAMALAGARPARIRRRLERAQAVHYPLTIALPEVRRPFAVTLFDILHHDLPRLFPRWEAALRRVAYDRSARRAAIVIVPTQAIAERASARLGIPSERIRVIHLGVDRVRFSPDADTRREPFLLYPARPWPHKNHARLFEALALVRRTEPDVRLVLTGGGHAWPSLPPGVEVRGLVDEDELVELYRRAAALVFPSLYEGFGSPPLEAMACGCPVVASRIPPLEEVCGDAARYVDPKSAEDIAQGVLDVLASGDDRAARGLERAAAFSWDAAAAAHEAVYEELLRAARLPG